MGLCFVRRRARKKYDSVQEDGNYEIAILFHGFGLCYCRKEFTKLNQLVLGFHVDGNEISTAESLQFDLSMIEAATNNFSDDNRLGEGGFGAVYKVGNC